MYLKVLEYVFGLKFLGKFADFLNGKKTITGLVAVLLATLHTLPSLLGEQYGYLHQIALMIEKFLSLIGVPLVTTGLIHKIIKSIKGLAKKN
jgi:hypothetical protein